ncbi:MAG: hypothetical protein AABZ30_07255 [Myxococcota bacterium]
MLKRLSASLVAALVGIGARPARAIEPGGPGRAHGAGVSARAGMLVGEPRDLAQDWGIGFGVHGAWFYRPHLGLRLELDYDRFAGLRETRTRLSYATLGLMPVAAYGLGPWLAWAGVGAGVVIAHFRTNALAFSRDPVCEYDPTLGNRCPASEAALVPVGRASGGVGYEVARNVVVGARFEYDLVVSDRTVAEKRVTYPEDPNEKPSIVEDEVVSRIHPFDDTMHLVLGVEHFF